MRRISVHIGRAAHGLAHEHGDRRAGARDLGVGAGADGDRLGARLLGRGASAATSPESTGTTEMPSPSEMAWREASHRGVVRVRRRSGARRSSARGTRPRARAIVPRPCGHALDVVRREALELGAVAVRAGEVERVHVHVRGEHRRELVLLPVRTFTTPPGTSDVASTSASVTAASGRCSDATTTAAFPPDEGRRERARRARRARLSSGAMIADDADRLRDREVEVRPGDGVRRAEHLRELVRPARVPDPAVDGRRHLGLVADELGELGAAALEHLGDAVEHLAAVVRRQRRPSPAAPSARRGRRRARPCGRPARRSRPRPRTCGPTRSAGTCPPT